MKIFHTIQFRPTVHRMLFVALMLSSLLIPGVAQSADSLVVYSGRAERLIKPVLDRFEKETGIKVQLLTSKTAELVNRLRAEGENTPADILITNDAAGLERARQLGLLQPLSSQDNIQAHSSTKGSESLPPSDLKNILSNIPEPYRADDNSWVGLSGRFYVVVYNTTKVKPDEIESILDLADPKWKGKIAIENAGSEYLQSGVSVIKAAHGEDATRKFLQGLKDNAENRVYGKSSQLVKAVARGEVSMGLVNHYYVFRQLAKEPKAPIATLMPDQQQGGMGAILNVAGVAVTKPTKHVREAHQLVAFLASSEGQEMFADMNKEYPLNPEVKSNDVLPKRASFRAATVPLGQLSDLHEPAMTLIEEVGMR
ncbi:MAG: putative binding protein component of ABC iron transporter [Nitrospirales bacterium]|nr:MAG: putative binding protein component of ABC iron transporter [Nitrospirales bacterium]